MMRWLALVPLVAAQCDELSLLQFSQKGVQNLTWTPVGDNQSGLSTSVLMRMPLVPVDGDVPFAQSWVVESVSFEKGVTGEPKQYWMMTGCFILLILLAISPICMKEGITVLLLVMSYLASLVCVKIFVKEAIDRGFPYPESITALHMLGLCLITGSLQRPELKEAPTVLPISLLHGASLMTNNTALLFGGVAFVSMVAANVPFIIFVLEVGKRTRQMDLASVGAVLLVCCGSIFCVYGEPAASLSAFILASLSALLGALRAVWQHELVVVSLHPLHMVFWNGFWSLVISVALMASNERTKAFTALPNASHEAKAALLVSAVMAVILNITQWYAVQKLGALMQSMIGNLNLILVMALSSAYLQEQVTLAQYVGVLLLSLGTFWNKAREVVKEKPSQDGG